MSVIGIDLGNKYCTIAQAKRGGIDIVLNENSKRLNPSVVSLQGNERFACEAAVPLERSNYKNTVKSIKRLIGRKYSEAVVQNEIQDFVFYKVLQLDDDEIGIEVMYDGVKRVFPPQQLLAMLLAKLQDIANDANPAAKVADVVLSVPPYYTDQQRHAVLDAARIANVNCLRLLNEPTAAALAYGIFKSARGAFSETDRRVVMFADMGETHFTASVVEFLQGKAKVLSSVSNVNIGSRSIDLAVARFLAEEFQNQSGISVWDKPKARLKLMKSAEKAKKTLSPEGVPLARVNIECLSGDNDLTTSVTEEKFAELCEPILAGIEAPIRQALEMAQINDVGMLHTVEIVGGGMRSRCVKQKLAGLVGVSGKAPNYGLSTTLNMDECIARGCALQCAVLSPQFRISKEFKVADVVPYGIRITWNQAGTADATMDTEDGDGPADTADDNTIVLYNQGDEFPRSRRLTFRRRTGFDIIADYEEAKLGTPLPDGAGRRVGKFTIPDPPADCLPADGSAPKIRVNFTYDHSGVFCIHSAQVFKEVPAEPEVQPPPVPAPAPAPGGATDGDGDVDMEAKAKGDGSSGDAASTQPAEGDAAGAGAGAGTSDGADASGGDKPADAAATEGADKTAAASGESKASDAKPTKPKFKRVNLNVDFVHPGYTAKQLMEAVEQEAQMQQTDKIIRLTQAKRNELESYIYDARTALYDLGAFMEPQESGSISTFLDESENWLYDAFDAKKKEFQAKLDEVKSRVEPVRRRQIETSNRPTAIANMRSVCDDYKRTANSTEERLAHLTDDDRNNIRKYVAAAETWLNEQSAIQEKLSMTANPVLTCKQISDKVAQLRRECNPIANKPKPAPKPAKEEAKKDEAAAPAPAAGADAGADAPGGDGSGAGAGAGAGADGNGDGAADAAPSPDTAAASDAAATDASADVDMETQQ